MSVILLLAYCKTIRAHHGPPPIPASFEVCIHTVKTPLIRDIVHKQNTHRSSVVSGCDRSETLLPCSIPYLQLNPLSIELNRADLEIDTDGCDE
jgi:hypothetical protein